MNIKCKFSRLFFCRLKGSIEIPLLLINTMFTKECTKGVDDDWAVSGLNFDWSSDIKKSLSS